MARFFFSIQCCWFLCLFPYLVNIMISLSRSYNFWFGIGVVIYYNSDRVYHRINENQRERAEKRINSNWNSTSGFDFSFFQIIYSHKKEHIILNPNGAIKNLSIPHIDVIFPKHAMAWTIKWKQTYNSSCKNGRKIPTHRKISRKKMWISVLPHSIAFVAIAGDSLVLFISLVFLCALVF